MTPIYDATVAALGYDPITRAARKRERKRLRAYTATIAAWFATLPRLG